MHQPPTIPEGDEENEGVEHVSEGTRFPHTGVPQAAPPIHDTVATAAELQPREDSGVGYGQTPTLQNELIAVSGGIPTEAAQQAEYKRPSLHDGLVEDDGANIGGMEHPEHELGEPLDAADILPGIRDDVDGVDEPALTNDDGKPLSIVVDSPTPLTSEPVGISPRHSGSEDHTHSHENLHLHPDDHRRSGRERSPRHQRDIPQVDFENLDQEDEHELIPEEPEMRISREELIARYQAAETERDRLKSINLALQQRLADYLHKRKGAEDAPALGQGHERSLHEQQQRYQKYLSEIETLQDRIKHDQIDYEKKRNEYELHIQKKSERVEQLKADYVKLVKEIASKAVFARSGKSISHQEVENYLILLKEREDELIKTRHENIRLKNQLKKREAQLKSKEEPAKGIHMIDFEQLKIENQTYSEKIEERNEELLKLRKKISTTVQILSHIKEKLNFVTEQRKQAEAILADKDTEVKQRRDELSSIKRRRDHLRQENQSLKQNSGLIGNEQLLRDYEERYDEIEKRTEKLDSLKKRHAEITLTCKVLKKKIAKV